MKVTLEVTQEDIDSGVMVDGERCMVARCLARYFPGHKLLVGSFWIRWFSDTEVVRLLLPSYVADKILMFDLGKTVTPFSFELDVPELLTPVNLHIGKPEKIVTVEEPSLPVPPMTAPVKVADPAPIKEPVPVSLVLRSK